MESLSTSASIHPPSMITTIKIGSDNAVFLRNKANEEEAIRRITAMLQHMIEEDTDGSNVPLLGEASEIYKLMSNLYKMNNHNEKTMQKLQNELVDISNKRDKDLTTIAKLERQLRDERNGFAIASYQHMQEIEEWKRTTCRLESEANNQKQKDCSSTMTTDTTSSASTLDTTSLDDTDTHPDADDDHVSVKTDVKEWKERYDELVDKINDLAEENEELLTKCHQLELASLASSFKGNTERRVSFDDRLLANAKGNEEGGKQQPMQLLEKRYKESLATIDTLQAENDMLHKSIDEAMEDSCGVNEVNQYCQQQLASITQKLEQTTLSKEVIKKELQHIKDQNKALRTEAEEAKASMEHYELEVKELESCRMNAYHTCEVLQKEIDFLHERLDSSIEEHDTQLYRWSINEY